MNTDQLKSFIQVAENLNFARAAEILNITQSAVSRQIHSLEEELGTRLLHRTTRTVTLTPAGISFLEDAKNVVGRPDVASRKFPSIISQLALACSSANWLIFFSPMRKYFAASSMVRVHVRMHFSQMGISA